MSLTAVLIVVALLVLNGLFVAAEFAIIGAPRAAIERRAAQGHAVARLVEAILHDPVRQDRFIATAQLGITVASLGLGMYGEHQMADWIEARLIGLTWLPPAIAAHTLATVVAVAILTYLHIVIGEMVPKSLALTSAEETALWVVRPMLVIQTALKPFVVGLNGLGNGVLHLLGVRRELSTGHFYSSDELQYLVEESEAGGLLPSEAGQMLRDLFSFGERTADEIMVPRVRVTGLPLGATSADLRRTLTSQTHTRYPVYEGDLDHILGVVHIKDLLRLVRADRRLSRAAVRPTAFVSAQSELDEVLDAMRQARTQLVVVMDEHGGTDGIVTIEDLCEEAVGEVAEGVDEAPDVRPTGDGSLDVAGTVRLEELGDALDRSLDDDEVDSVSGLILARLNRPPAVGDAIDWRGLRLEVTAVAGHGVARARVTDARGAADDA